MKKPAMAAIRSMQRLCSRRSVATSCLLLSPHRSYGCLVARRQVLSSSLSSFAAATPTTSAVSYVCGGRSLRLTTPITARKTFCSAASEEPFIIVDFDDVKERCLKKNSVLLDVRNPEELGALGFIPGAKNIPVDQMPDAFSLLSPENFKATYGFEMPYDDEDIVVYCRSGKRAVTACQVLHQAGYSKLFLYKGSWNEWEEKNGPK